MDVFIKVPGTFKLVTGQAYRIDDSTNGIHQRKSGQGRIYGKVCAEFNVDKTLVSNKVLIESKVLIRDVVTSHKKLYLKEGPYW